MRSIRFRSYTGSTRTVQTGGSPPDARRHPSLTIPRNLTSSSVPSYRTPRIVAVPPFIASDTRRSVRIPFPESAFS